MSNLVKNTPQILVVLASLILWASFAWGLPADAPAAEGEAAAAPKDPWARVRLSDAYDYAKCTGCGKKNQIRAESCSRCGYELPQPSAEMTDPDMVFVPGKGYYRKGTLLEPAKSRKGLWVTGLVLSASAIGTFIIIEVGEASHWWQPVAGVVYGPLVSALIAIVFVGGVLFMIGITERKEPVYAFASGELYEPYESETFARRSPDPDGAALKVEVTVLGF